MNIEIFDEKGDDVRALQKLLVDIPGMTSLNGLFGFGTAQKMVASYSECDAAQLPDIVILEAQFADGSATKLIPLIRKSPAAKIPIYIYTRSHDEALLKSCLTAGATKIFHKDPAGEGGRKIAALIASQAPLTPPDYSVPPAAPTRSQQNSPEGYYASIQEAEAHVQMNLDLLRRVQPSRKGAKMTLVYFFRATLRAPLAAFLAAMAGHGFINCIPSAIDDDPDNEVFRFNWVPSKIPPRITGKLLLSEFHKYQSLADVHGVSYGGVTCQVE